MALAVFGCSERFELSVSQRAESQRSVVRVCVRACVILVCCVYLRCDFYGACVRACACACVWRAACACACVVLVCCVSAVLL